MAFRVLINPESGAVRSFGPRALRDRIRTDLRNAHYEAEFIFGSAPRLRDAASDFVKCPRADLVVAAGGDGTLAAVCEGLAGEGVPLLPLPGGTMNLFVQDLAIPNDLERALATALYGQPKSVDLGFVNGRAFVNNVVFGAYAEIANAREIFRRASTPGETAGAVADAADAVMSAAPKKYAVTVDDFTETITSNVMMVSNNRYTGAVGLRPVRRRLDQGVLYLYITESRDGPELILRIAEAVSGKMAQSPAVHLRPLKACTIASADHVLSLAVDGDPLTIDGPAEVRILPKAVTIIAPAPGVQHSATAGV